MKIVNLTPHPLTLYRIGSDDPLASWPACADPVRIDETDLRVAKDWIEDEALRREGWGYDDEQGNYQAKFPIVHRQLSEISLPDPEEDTLLCVSLPILMHLLATGAARVDVIAPDTGPSYFGAVRDETGRVKGCRRFVTLAGLPEGMKSWSADEWEAAQRGTPQQDKAKDLAP